MRISQAGNLSPGNSTSTGWTVASGSGSVVKSGPGSQLQAARGSNTSFIVTMGDSAASGSTFQRRGYDTFVIIPGTITGSNGYDALGTTSGPRENIIVKGTAPTSKNGMVAPYIASWTSSGSSSPEFLDYGANGFKSVTYSSLTSIDDPSVNNTTVFRHTTVTTVSRTVALTGNRTVYALNLADVRSGAGKPPPTPGTSSPIDPNGFTLTIGDGTGPAGMLMAINGQIGTPTSVAGSALQFDGTEIDILTQNTAVGNIHVPITATSSTAPLVKFGYGSLTLNAAATYGGPTVIGAGTLSLR